MRTRRLTALIAATALLSGCFGSGPLEPIDPEEVVITLSVSGGFAGVSYAFVVDGADLEVVGLDCDSFCDWGVGDLLLPVSAAQVEDLAGRLERADVFDRSGDYGTQCCDDFYYDLSYQRGARLSRVRGSSMLLPDELRGAIGHLSALADGRMPLLVSPDTDEADWGREPYTLGLVEATGITLTATVTYGGGCSPHRMDLVAWGAWMESEPVQINALITHDDGDDICDALVTEERVFDLSPLARAYTEAYGPVSGPIRVNLRLWDPLGAGPVGRLIALEM